MERKKQFWHHFTRPPNPKIAVLIGVLFASSSAIFVRFSDAAAPVIAAYRMVFTCLILTPVFTIEKLRKKSAPTEKVKLALADLTLCILSGLFLSLHFLTWIFALDYTSIASATVLVDTHPVFITLLSFIILKERISKRSLLLIVVALTGSIVIAVGGKSEGTSVMLGNLLALAGALMVSAYMLIGRAVRQRVGLNTYTFIVYLSSAFFLLLISLVGGYSLTPYPAHEFLIFLCLALFPTLLGHSVFNWALKYLKPSFISAMILGEPVGAGLLAVIFFAEFPTLITIIGGLIILCSLYLLVKQESS